MIRLLWPALLLVISLIAVGAQLDRQVRNSPHLADIVPAPFRGFAQTELARRAIATKDATAAQAEARALIATRPVPADHLALMAQAKLLAGETEPALVLAQRAAHRGWRDTPTQLLMFRLALAADDGREMARRLAAMWALQADRRLLGELTPLVLAQPAARREFISILAAEPRWMRLFDNFARRELSENEYRALRIQIEQATLNRS